MIQRLSILLIAVLLIWGGWWFFASRSLRADVVLWFEDHRADGWVAEYDSLAIRGFPNRLDVTLEGVTLGDPQTGVLWETDLLQIFRVIYQPSHQIVAIGNNQTLSSGGRRYDIQSTGMGASLVSDAESKVLRFNAEADTLNIAGPEGALAMAGATLGVARGETEASYLLGLVVEQIAGPQSTLAGDLVDVEALAIRALVNFDQPWFLHQPDHRTPQPDSINLHLAEFQSRGLDLKATGIVELDDTGRPSGSLTLRADNWREGLADARDTGALPQWLADVLDGTLGALTLLGNGKSLDVTIRMDDGQATLGVLPLGQVPSLRLP